MQDVYCLGWPRKYRGAPAEPWLAAARQGEPEALEQFYAAYRGPLYGLCFRILGHAEDAEDALQAAFIRAFRELPRFRGDSSVKTWVYRIAIHECLNLRRKRREVCGLEEQRASAGDGVPALCETLLVEQALSRLSPEHRGVLALRFWEGLSGAEIAQVLGITGPAAKMRLHRARVEFRRHYEELK